MRELVRLDHDAVTANLFALKWQHSASVHLGTVAGWLSRHNEAVSSAETTPRDRMTALAREMAQGASGSIRDLVSKTEVLMDWLDPNGSAWGRQAHPTERQTVTFRQLDDVWNITAIGAKPEK